jgi:hypothetical protein
MDRTRQPGRGERNARGPVSRVLCRGRFRFRPMPRRQPFIWAVRRRAARAANPDPLGRSPLPVRSCDRLDAGSLFGLAPGGVCHAGVVTKAPVRSYRTLSALLPELARLAVYSLWHFPYGRPRRALPATLASWSPDFPRSPLSRRTAAARPPGGPYLVRPSSRSKSNWNRMARISPSISPSILRGRQRRWKASTAL